MSSKHSSRRGSSQSSLSSTGSSLTATRDLWRLRQTMHCLEKCEYYHGSLNRNNAREKMRRCRPGCFLIRDSNDPAYLFTLQQTLHFVGPCATRIAFVQGLFRFQDSNGQILLSNSENTRGFPCVIQLIEHYSSKYSEMSVIALRYPVSKEGEINMNGIGENHSCFVDCPSADDVITPRIIHPEIAASLAGSGPSCMSCTSHSGPQLESDRVLNPPVEKVNRSNSDGSIAVRSQSITASPFCAQDLKISLTELQLNQTKETNMSMIFPGLAPMISTERRSSVEMNNDPIDQYGGKFRVGPMTALTQGAQNIQNGQSDYNLNNGLGDIQIDLDNLGEILGGVSITVQKPTTEHVKE